MDVAKKYRRSSFFSVAEQSLASAGVCQMNSSKTAGKGVMAWSQN